MSAPQRLKVARALCFGAALARIDVEPFWLRYERLRAEAAQARGEETPCRA